MTKTVKISLSIFAAICSLLSTAVAACEVEGIFSGGTVLSKGQMPTEKGHQGYEYFLVLNGDRDQSGMLNSFIKAQLRPARWGYDVITPGGKLVGQVLINVRNPRLPRNTYEITMDHDETCPKESIYLMQSGKTDLIVSLRGKVIGKLQNRYLEAFK